MHPHLFGIEWLESYTIMIMIGILVALFVFKTYSKKLEVPYRVYNFYLILSVVSLVVGFIAAFLFQQVYHLIADYQNNRTYYPRGLTFMGGLVGGVICFMVGVMLFARDKERQFFFKILAIAAASISIGHAFGRIGCTLAGCCYGVETNSWIGIQFITTSSPVVPTQLIEALFLTLLSIVLLILLEKKKWQYNIFIYGISYSVFRFIIEYYRGDLRGAFLPFFTPSQWQVLFMFIATVGLLVVYQVKYVKNITGDSKPNQKQ